MERTSEDMAWENRGEGAEASVSIGQIRAEFKIIANEYKKELLLKDRRISKLESFINIYCKDRLKEYDLHLPE